jgi:cell division septation protein DedD
LPKNDDGEFELVLGNRQLISVFLIVVILLGVFFSMGYIVGRNSSPATENARNEKPKPDADSDTSDGSNPDATSDGANSGNDAATSTATEATHPEATKPVQTKPAQPPPAQTAPAPAPPKPAPVRVQETKPKPSPSPAPAPAPVRPPVRAAASGEPSGGQYWQVVATSRPDAEIIAEALGKKGFHVVLSPAPRDGIFRVLVGPLGDASTQAQTRTGLESAGFKNPILRKY